MIVAIKTRLRQFREELAHPKVSQESMARQVGISLQWYRQLENGLAPRTSWSCATALLRTLNAERQQRNLQALTLEQLELHIV
ncbi:MAG: helix-turn-helix domain-containing protein [Ktedonobacteraceae bacterium]